MDEKLYNDLLLMYRQGTEFQLVTNRKNGEVQNQIYVDYTKDEKTGELTSCFRFLDGKAVFDPKTIGGIENIVSIECSEEGMC
jgi:hypothetical protein